jgi:hypothetical protein
MEAGNATADGVIGSYVAGAGGAERPVIGSARSHMRSGAVWTSRNVGMDNGRGPGGWSAK